MANVFKVIGNEIHFENEKVGVLTMVEGGTFHDRVTTRLTETTTEAYDRGYNDAINYG